MILHIKNDTTLGDVQKSFSKTFPYLKIEFVPVETEEIKKDNSILDLQLKNIQKKKLFPNLLQVQPWYTYVDVENLFYSMFGLSIKLLSKNEANWIEASEDLPVKELNKKASDRAEYNFHIKREKQVHIW